MKTVFAVAVLAAYASAKKEPKAKDCKPEDWKFKCNELVPDFDEDCVVKYSFDPCDDFGESDVCRMHMDKKDKEGQDCIHMLQNPESWG